MDQVRLAVYLQLRGMPGTTLEEMGQVHLAVSLQLGGMPGTTVEEIGKVRGGTIGGDAAKETSSRVAK